MTLQLFNSDTVLFYNINMRFVSSAVPKCFLLQSRREKLVAKFLQIFKYANIMILNLKNGSTIECEQIRFCSLSSGVKIGVFRNLDKRAIIKGQYVIIVKKGREFLHQLCFVTLLPTLQTYLDYICRYA